MKQIEQLDVVSPYQVIPFGHRCTSAIVANFAQLRKCSLPFDWTIPLFPGKIREILRNNFEGFIPENICLGNVVNQYGVKLTHFHVHNSVEEGIETYERRIRRFSEMMQSNVYKYFIYVNEDFLFDPKFREEEFNRAKFDEMCALEEYIKENYAHFKFTILYFDFGKHTPPADSNILPILLKSTQYWEVDRLSPYNSFREYVGRIASTIFKSEPSEKLEGIDFRT
ncbi:MAG: hypothetical protein JXR76_01235 [Deltaproteobacteria bacterium]|nr:hypothetical protein [Deltaproteobacteria bacterium]